MLAEGTRAVAFASVVDGSGGAGPVELAVLFPAVWKVEEIVREDRKVLAELLDWAQTSGATSARSARTPAVSRSGLEVLTILRPCWPVESRRLTWRLGDVDFDEGG